MNISYNWLKEYVDFDLTPDEVAAALTSIGLETGSVEEVQTVKGGLEGLVIGEVLTCVEHPNSDHLHITTVNLGDGEPVQIVCGAPNVAAGQKVVVATLGTKLYDGDECFTIKKSKIRGVESTGMICAEDEIGIGTDHAGIIVLPENAVPGTLAKDYYNIKSDYVLEVDITPNRADACSHYGVARDLYAYLIQNGKQATLQRPSVDDFKVENHDLDIEVKVENSEACPHYAGVTVKGVTVKESPEWLQNKLRLIGVRPINNVVDVTNYIVHAFGQPLHCFDAGKIKGNEVIVKTMPEGTLFVTLDEVERKLSDRDLMICNKEEAMCIAGVFGGLDSGSTEATTDVFIESAYFHPTWVRKTARRHGLNTDASFRFEKGKKYALIGPSGCGKSTLLKILLGWLPEYQGTIRFDGRDIREYTPEQLQQQMSYIEQNVFLFNASIRENITLDEDFTEEQLRKAIHDSALENDLLSMPNGLDTLVGEGGCNISGGQKQRVAIARALIHERSILLVDEGTSALDAQNADLVEKSLLANPNLTLILISHHLSDKRKAQFDCVYELMPTSSRA